MAEPQTMFEQIILSQLNLIIQNQFIMNQNAQELIESLNQLNAKSEKISGEVKSLHEIISHAPATAADVTDAEWSQIKQLTANLFTSVTAIDALTDDVVSAPPVEVPAPPVETPSVPVDQIPPVETPPVEAPTTPVEEFPAPVVVNPSSTEPML